MTYPMSRKYDVDTCPDRDRLHTRTVRTKGGYAADPVTGRSLSPTHRQTQCPTCGRWAIWVPKQRPRIEIQP